MMVTSPMAKSKIKKPLIGQKFGTQRTRGTAQQSFVLLGGESEVGQRSFLLGAGGNFATNSHTSEIRA